MDKINNAIAAPAINPTMNNVEIGRFHASSKREARRRMAASITLNAKLWLVAVAERGRACYIIPKIREKGGDMLQGFKQFMLRGNVLDLAVAVVMGAAFGAVVTALVKDLITPLIAALIGKPDFSAIDFTMHGSKFALGDFINAIVSFILIGAAVYFFVVLPVNNILARMRRGEAAPDPTTKKCPECLSDVPIAARRCAFCTSPLMEAR
jgi:large conductance mechanosensitive channel